MAVNSTCLENDKFGYACYTIVAPAPKELAGPLLEIERTALRAIQDPWPCHRQRYFLWN